MRNILIINAHLSYPFSPGKLNQSLADKAATVLTGKGHTTRIVNISEETNVENAIADHQWADTIILQSPVNWMGVPWTFKKYMDEVYTAGMAGALCHGDGRSAEAPKANYGAGGALAGKTYMLSLTFNAPKEAFNDESEYLFQGKSVDDLFLPMHMNFRFFAMTALPTFVCYDVMKNPSIEQDFERFESHLNSHF